MREQTRARRKQGRDRERQLRDPLPEVTRRGAQPGEARREDQVRLDGLMDEKAGLEYEAAQWRLVLQRGSAQGDDAGRDTAEARLGRLRARLDRLDEEIGPLAASLGSLTNATWGPLMHAGNDRSLLAHQVELSADVYTSRVSNLGLYTPFAYLRAPRGQMPHDVRR